MRDAALAGHGPASRDRRRARARARLLAARGAGRVRDPRAGRDRAVPAVLRRARQRVGRRRLQPRACWSPRACSPRPRGTQPLREGDAARARADDGRIDWTTTRRAVRGARTSSPSSSARPRRCRRGCTGSSSRCASRRRPAGSARSRSRRRASARGSRDERRQRSGDGARLHAARAHRSRSCCSR